MAASSSTPGTRRCSDSLAASACRLDDTWDTPGGSDRLWLKGARPRPERRRSTRSPSSSAGFAGSPATIGPYNYRHHSGLAREIDEMTARDMVDQLPARRQRPASLASRSTSSSRRSSGWTSADLSGLAVIDNFVGTTPGADERYHVRGGNDQIVHGLADTLPRHAITMDAAAAAACTDAATAGS